MKEIIRAGAWAGFRELVEELGGSPDEVLAAARVDPAVLQYPERYVPLAGFIASQEIAARKLNRPDFGLMFGAADTLQSLGALAIAILNSNSAREGVETAARHIHIQNPSLEIALSPIPRTQSEFLAFTLRTSIKAPRAQNEERMIASAHMALKQIAGADYVARSVRFTHAPLSPLVTYRKVFGIVPQFGQPGAGIAIERKVLDAFQPGRSAELRRVAESFLRALGRPRQVGVAQRAAGLIPSLLQSGECTPANVAAALGMHERTLQRRLKEEGASFEQIKDDIRRELAEGLLAQPNVSLSHIAMALDYADASAFSRSARRWFGEPPTAVRARLQSRPRRVQEDPGISARMHPLLVARRLSRNRDNS